MRISSFRYGDFFVVFLQSKTELYLISIIFVSVFWIEKYSLDLFFAFYLVLNPYSVEYWVSDLPSSLTPKPYNENQSSFSD